MTILTSAFHDISRAWKMRAVWRELALEDVTDQHRATALGPLWQLVNYLAFAGAFMIIFADLNPVEHYGSYVATGLLVWLFISELLANSVLLFLREQSFIKGTNLPISLYIMRLSTQFYIRLAYAVCGCIALLLIDGLMPSPHWLTAASGLILIILTAPAAIAVFAFLGAYFPDMSFIIANLMRLGMFLTPIFWLPGNSPIRDKIFSELNPFTYYLEIVRKPVLEEVFPVNEFAVTATLSSLLWLTAIFAIGAFRKRVVFVLQ